MGISPEMAREILAKRAQEKQMMEQQRLIDTAPADQAVRPDNPILGTLKEIPGQAAGVLGTALNTTARAGANLAAGATQLFASPEYMAKLRQSNTENLDWLQQQANRSKAQPLVKAATEIALSAPLGPLAVGVMEGSRDVGFKKKPVLSQLTDAAVGIVATKVGQKLGEAVTNRLSLYRQPGVQANLAEDVAAGIKPNLTTAAVGQSDDLSKTYREAIKTEGSGVLKRASKIGEQVKTNTRNFLDGLQQKFSAGLGENLDDVSSTIKKSFDDAPDANKSVFDTIKRPILNQKTAENIEAEISKLKFDVKGTGYQAALKHIDDLQRSLADPNITLNQAWKARMSYDEAIGSIKEGLSLGQAKKLQTAVRKVIEPRLEEVAGMVGLGKEFKTTKALYRQSQVYNEFKTIISSKSLDPETSALDTTRVKNLLIKFLDDHSYKGKVKGSVREQIPPDIEASIKGFIKLAERHRLNIKANVNPSAARGIVDNNSMVRAGFDAARGVFTNVANALITSPTGLKMLGQLSKIDASSKQMQDVYNKLISGATSQIPSVESGKNPSDPNFVPPQIDFTLGNQNNGSN